DSRSTFRSVAFAVAFGSWPSARSSSRSPSTLTVVLAICIPDRCDLDETVPAFVRFLHAVDRPDGAIMHEAISRRNRPRFARRAHHEARADRRADLTGCKLLAIADIPAHRPAGEEIRPRLDPFVELVRNGGDPLYRDLAVEVVGRDHSEWPPVFLDQRPLDPFELLRIGIGGLVVQKLHPQRDRALDVVRNTAA